MQKKQLPRQQLSGRVIEQLYHRIADGLYSLHQRLPTEQELMHEFAVGRSTVREAVQALAHMGMLEVRQGSGTYVRALPRHAESLADRLRRARMVEIHEARRAIEIEIARLAAKRRTDADIKAMRIALEQREFFRCTTPFHSDAFITADLAFHTAIAQAAANQVLFDVYLSLTEAIRPSLIELAEYHELHQVPTAPLADFHQQVFFAICQQDEEATRYLVETLLNALLDGFS